MRPAAASNVRAWTRVSESPGRARRLFSLWLAARHLRLPGSAGAEIPAICARLRVGPIALDLVLARLPSRSPVKKTTLRPTPVLRLVPAPKPHKESKTMITDKELSNLGEGLYEAVLQTPLPLGTVHGLATAIRNNVPWGQLPQHLKFAVFKIVAVCMQETEADAAAPEGDSDAPHAGIGDAPQVGTEKSPVAVDGSQAGATVTFSQAAVSDDANAA